MASVKMHEAKTNLSKLAARAQAGEEIILMRGNEPIAKLVPMHFEARLPREPGLLKGLIDFDDRFFEPLREEELKLWEGE